MDFPSTLGASIPVFQKLEPATVSPLTVLALSVLIVVALLVIFFGPELGRRSRGGLRPRPWLQASGETAKTPRAPSFARGDLEVPKSKTPLARLGARGVLAVQKTPR
jgi:hypothetical protein